MPSIARRSYAAALLAALCASFAEAQQDLEHKALSDLGKGVGLMFVATPEKAKAHCDTAAAEFPADAPRYLLAYYEICRAVTAAPTGPQKKPESCPYYKKAVEIWTKFPPPKDDDESRIKRAERLHGWRKAIVENCPGAAPLPVRSSGTWSSIDGPRVKTKEGLSYRLPLGWHVTGFDEITGKANVAGPRDHGMRVQRIGAKEAASDFPDRKALADGRELEFVHKPFIKDTAWHVFYAQIRLPEAIVAFGISRHNKDGSGASGVDRAEALAWVTEVAESLKVTGPRACIGDCPPGAVTPRTK